VPSSGALSYLKGDLYLPLENKNRFCIEVKNYEKSPFTDKIFTNKTNYLLQWWPKVVEQAGDFEQEPLLFFKYSRSKIYVVTEIKPKVEERYVFIAWLNCYVLLAEDWLKAEDLWWCK
jgi:hypothetical protein